MQTYKAPYRHPYIYGIMAVLLAVLIMNRSGNSGINIGIVITITLLFLVVNRTREKLVITHEYIILSSFSGAKKIPLKKVAGYRFTPKYLVIYPKDATQSKFLKIHNTFLAHNPQLVQWVKTNLSKLR